MTVTCVVGGQFGSEGKGAIAAHIAKEYNIHVRVGAANAGHTVYTPGTIPPDEIKGSKSVWEKHVLQQLPCAAYTNPEAELVLGPGALISDEILATEIQRNEIWRKRLGHPPLSLLIDWRAHIVTLEHIEREQDTDLAARIGSTSTIAKEGIGAATAARVMREAECLTAGENVESLQAMVRDGSIAVDDAVADMHLSHDANILLEGTQGTGLSLTTGFPPYTTSRNTTAAGIAADCGFGPGEVDKTIIVMRTSPIRVAGNSGPFYGDSQETTFEELGVEPERTTVTKLVRRVATFSNQQALDAVWLNRGQETEIALTFVDYLCPGLANCTDLPLWQELGDEEGNKLMRFLRDLRMATGAPVTMLGTGPHSVITSVPSIQCASWTP